MTAFNTFTGLRWNGVRPVAWPWLPVLAAGLLGLVTGSSARAQAPLLTAVSPASGSTGVAVTNVIRFTFDRAMDDMVPIMPSVPPFLVGNLEFTPTEVSVDTEWSTDKRTLICTPTGDLPASTLITWKLNPAGSLFSVQSSAGVALATVSGSFTTGTAGGGGGGGETPPELVSSTPASGSMGVALTVAVTFNFDMPMKKDPAVAGAVAWFGSGVDAAKFTYSWSADGKTLTADYAGNLPAQSQVMWKLNAEDATVLLQNEAGEPLGETAGAFFTGTDSGGGGDCEPDGVPETWGGYTVMKQGQYLQTSAADPVPAAEDPFMFGAIVMSPDAGPAATAGSVTLPGGTVKNLQPVGLGGMLMTSDSPATAAALDSAYPGGSYVLRFTQTGKPQQVITMAVPASNPPVPKVANYEAAQAVNAGLDFTLQWNAFTGAAGFDSISLVVSGTNLFVPGVVFQAPDLCVPRPLAATATSIVIPANTFKSNQTYTATLTFNRVGYMSTNSIADMAGFGGSTRTTEFTIKTGTSGGGTAEAARFVGYRILPNGNPEFTLTGTAGRSYTLQRTGNLGSPNWSGAGGVTMDAAGRAVFEDTAPGKVPPLFYRAMSN